MHQLDSKFIRKKMLHYKLARSKNNYTHHIKTNIYWPKYSSLRAESIQNKRIDFGKSKSCIFVRRVENNYYLF